MKNLFKRLFATIFLYGIVVSIVLILSCAKTLAVTYNSENYSLEDVNFGEQIFYTAEDTAKPYTIANGPEVIALTPYTATIKWLTNESSTSTVLYGTSSGAYNLESSKAFDNTAIHTVDLTNLSPQTKYYYKAMFRNEAGNVGESEEKAFTTPLPVPQITDITLKDITETSAVVSFNTDFFTTSVIEYINLTTLEKRTVGESGYFKIHSMLLENLTSNQAYSATILARDNEGHESFSSSVSFQTLKDTIPPKIENVKFETSQIAGKEKARIISSWYTSEISNSQVKFREGSSDQEEYKTTTLGVDMVANHVETISNLKPQTTYRVVLLSTDLAGNVGQSEEFIILTPKQKRTFFQIILDNIAELFKPFSALFS